MNPLASFGIRTDTYSQDMSGSNIRQLAQTIARRLTPYANRITIAGSIRRRQNPRDVDIVLIPRDKQGIRRVIIAMGGKIWGEGEQQIYFKLQGVNVNIYYADTGSYGAMLLTRTGSKGHEIGLRRIAKRKNLLLNQYGLYRGEKRIAGKSEREIYAVLGRPKFKRPEERQ